MCLNDEIKKPEGIEAQTYGRNNNLERELIWKQMQDFERSNKVTACPIGASSKHKPITKPESLENAMAGRDEYNKQKSVLRPPRNKGDGDFEFNPNENRSLEKATSGHQNIQLMPDGSCKVVVANQYLGTFQDVKIALDVRDRHRESAGLPLAEY